MALTFAEFERIMEADAKLLDQRKPPQGVLTCADCEIPLMESVTGNRQLGNGDHVCSDCYFEQWGDEIDDHPLLSPRLAHRS